MYCCNLLLSPQGTPAALMHEAFGRFLDDASSVSLDKHTCKAIMDLIESMSASYANTSTKADLAILKKLFGAAHKGRSRGTEGERAQLFRQQLLELITTLLPELPAFSLEPGSLSLVCCGAVLIVLIQSRRQTIHQGII